MAVSDLAYQIEESPSWRAQRHDGREQSDNGLSVSVRASPALALSSSRMLEAISSRIEEYERLSENARNFCDTSFSRGMAVEYVHHSNVGESVGTQEFEDTQRLLESVLNVAQLDSSSPGNHSDYNRTKSTRWSREELETINSCRALQKFHEEIRKEMEETGMLTVDQLCEVHAVLLEGVHAKNGKIRDSDVYTLTEEGIHRYPEAWRAEQRLYTLIDHHNINMEHYGEKKAEMTTRGKVEFLVKCAARLLFEFVDTHPFSDGNGRMCRLLANYVVSLITPFPIAVYHSASLSKRCHRDDFVSAIVKCRKNPQEGPRDLAAMILEGIYLGWESF